MTREVSDLIIAIVGALLMFVAMPWLFLHYSRRWREQDEINEANQRLIEELGERTRQLDDRAHTLERIARVEEPERITGPERLSGDNEEDQASEDEEDR